MGTDICLEKAYSSPCPFTDSSRLRIHGMILCYMGRAFECGGEDGTINIHKTRFIGDMMEKFNVTSSRSVPVEA